MLLRATSVRVVLIFYGNVSSDEVLSESCGAHAVGGMRQQTGGANTQPACDSRIKCERNTCRSAKILRRAAK